MNTLRNILAIAAAFALPQTALFAATGEVTLSGSTWTGKVDGTTRYTGTDLFACVSAVNANMGSSGGTINLRANGNSGASGGALKQIKLGNNVTLNGNNFTINCNSGDDWILPVKGESKSNIGTRNLRITGRVRYGVLYNSCNTTRFENVTVNASYQVAVALRNDNARGGTNTSCTVTTVTANSSGGSGSQAFGFESNDLTGMSAGTFNITDLNGCGVGSNTTNNATYGTINATRVCPGGSYAGFRTTNAGGSGTTTVTRVNATDCGRGSTYHANSRRVTVNYANNNSNDEYGFLIYSSPNNRLLDGYIRNNTGRGVQLTTDSTQTRDVLVQGVDTNDGINEGGGCNYNTIRDCVLNGSGLTKSGANTQLINNQL